MKYLAILLFIFPLALWANEEPLDGKKLFRNNCKACHNIDKKLVGPALKDVHKRRDSVWLYQFIKNSQEMISDGDSTAVALFAQFNQVLMPNQNLSNAEIGAILDYIKAESVPKVVDNPIQRPAEESIIVYDQLRFSNYFFWIPFTIAVILLIFALYYMTVLQDLSDPKAIE